MFIKSHFKWMKYHGYADDIVLTARGKCEEILCDIIQEGYGIMV